MPGARFDFDPLLSCKLRSFPGNDVIEAVIVFEGVHAGHIVIVGVLIAPDEPAALIAFAFDGFERHAQVHIGVSVVLPDAQVE